MAIIFNEWPWFLKHLLFLFLSPSLIHTHTHAPFWEKEIQPPGILRRRRGRRGVCLFQLQSWPTGRASDASQPQYETDACTRLLAARERQKLSEGASETENKQDTQTSRLIYVCVCVFTSPLWNALTKAQLSLEHERTVSVRPSRNSRVMDAS